MREILFVIIFFIIVVFSIKFSHVCVKCEKFSITGYELTKGWTCIKCFNKFYKEVDE